MWFEQLIRPETGCASYLVGSSSEPVCAVFDPLWEIAPYQKKAAAKGARITHVIDSHAHADHVSGARRLAASTGAELVLPELMECEYDGRRIGHGERIRLGEVELEAIHTPGHRPEQINLLIYDRSRGNEPWCLLTADFLMVGDVARPDLAQDGAEGAATLFKQTIPRVMGLPDFVEVYAGHVAGST